MGPRGPSAYFLFAEEQREIVKAELQKHDGKVGVAAIGKEIGARWQMLTDEQKKTYKEKAQELKAQLEAQAIDESGGKAQQAQVEEASQQHEAQGGGSAPPFGLPTSLVKRIITVDPDVQRISADGVRSIAKATELFLQLLAAQSFRQAALLKRKNLKFQDIQTVAGKDRRLTDLGLNEFLATDSVFAEIHERAGEENQSNRGNRKHVQDNKNVQKLTSFFSSRVAS